MFSRPTVSILFGGKCIRNCISMLPIDKLLYNTTGKIPRVAKYHDYPLAFKVPLSLVED